MKTAIIVPTIRQESIIRFMKEWNIEDNDSYTLFVFEDHLKKEINLPKYVKHYSHADIETFPPELLCVGSASNRIFGFWKAWKDGSYDYILTLDDDCYPEEGDTIFSLIRKHEQVLRPTRNNCFHHTMDDDYARGVPYVYRKDVMVAVSVGGWSVVPDLDGITQLKYELPPSPFPRGNRSVEIVPRYVPVTVCGMNVFFPTKMAPYVFFWPHLNTFYRYDDIWMGFVLKKYCDDNNLAMCINGNASVRHERASNAMTNMKKESTNGGYELNAMLAERLINNDYLFYSEVKEFNDYLHKIENLYEKWLALFGVQK